MSYKSIVVHLDTSARAQARLQIALHLAKQANAFLRGVFSIFSPDLRAFVVMAGSAEYYADHEKVRLEERGALERLFHAELARAGVEGEWVDADGEASEAVAFVARSADLVVIGQDDPNDPEAYVCDHFPENVVMLAGGPVLIVPYAGTFNAIGKRILVAWDQSREATRAVHDALPFLKQAEHVTILTASAHHSDTANPNGRSQAAELTGTLARHGVRADKRHVAIPSDVPIGDVLLAQASEIGADLVVMGGYGHTRWHELILGGATRTILHSATVPVLMSH
jgi:nucleotide-binding universal stress UspA family protein